MRIHCSAVAALLVLLGACSSSGGPEVSHEAYSNDGLTINVVYVCNPNLKPDPQRVRMQVKAQSDSAIPLVTTVEIDERLDHRTEHTLDAGATYNLEQVEAIGHTSVVHVYLKEGEVVTEIATATFRSDDHACQEGDADRSSE